MQSIGLYPGRNIFQSLCTRLYQSIRTLSFTSRKPECERVCDSEKNEKNDEVKVTVLGASGRVGRTLSLLLKTCPLIDHLCLFDINKTVNGISSDISHLDTRCSVSSVCGLCNIEEALQDPKVVLIAAGYPITPNLKGRKLFDKNAPIVAGLAEACALYCPQACVVLITNPINSLLPVAAEIYKAITCNIPVKKLFGLTTLDVIRANTFAAEATKQDPNEVIVPVIGGSSSSTIVPVLSQMKPYCKIKREETIALTECVKHAEANLLDCQHCGTFGSSSLSTAYAAFRFSTCLISALKGDKDIVECAYVKSNIIPELEYLASPLKLGQEGIECNFGYPNLSDYEVNLMENAAPVLKSQIDLGKSYVRNFMRKTEEKQLHCYSKPEEIFMSRKWKIIKRQDRRFGTCKPNEDPKVKPAQEAIKPKEPEKIFKYVARNDEKKEPSKHLKNLVETEKKFCKSKRLRSKKSKKSKIPEEEKEKAMLPSRKYDRGFPLFLASRASVPLAEYDEIEYCEVQHRPLNVFSIALYFFCFMVMYLFMSFRL